MPGAANDLNITESGYQSFNNTNGVFHGRTFQAGTGITLTNADGISGNTTIATTAALTDLHVARFIVASSTAGTGANYTTIAAAIAAAQGTGINSTVFIQPGTYTENLTLVSGINICAFDCDANTPNVTIVGTLTMTTAGTVSISGVRLQTNSAVLIAVTGSAASNIFLNNCYLNCTNSSAITFSSSSGSSSISLINCIGNLGTTGIKYFAHSSSGILNILYCNFVNTGGSSTANTASAGTLNISYSAFASPITTSGTNALTWDHIAIDVAGANVTSATLGGSGIHNIRYCSFMSGSASALSIGSATPVLEFCNVNSSNTNAITGAGTLTYAFIAFSGSSSGVNTSTVTPLATLI